SPSFQIKQRFMHILAAGRASRIRVCVDNFTMIRDPIYGGLMKRLDSDQPGWLSFDLDMWKGHRAYVELCDLATPDPTNDSENAPVGYITASRVVFSDHTTPPVDANAPSWLAL